MTLNNIKCHFWTCCCQMASLYRVYFTDLIELVLRKFRREGDAEETVFIRCVRRSFVRWRESTNFSSSVSVFFDIVKLVTRDSFTRNEGMREKYAKQFPSIKRTYRRSSGERARLSSDVFSDSALNKSVLSQKEGMKLHLFLAFRRNAHLYLHA